MKRIISKIVLLCLTLTLLSTGEFDFNTGANTNCTYYDVASSNEDGIVNVINCDINKYMSSSPSVPRYSLGDADGNGEINILDAVKLFKYIAGRDATPVDIKSIEFLRADADKNGEITVLDAVCIFRHLAGKEILVTPAEYTVTFETMGGSLVESQVIREGDCIAVPQDPTKKDCVFSGWYTDNNTFNNKYDFNCGVTQNIILYAKWNYSEAADINMFICYGQSWSTGYEASAISTTQRYNSIMLDTGIMNNPISDLYAHNSATSFVPLVEANGIDRGNGMSVGETPVSAQTNMVKQLMFDENGENDFTSTYQLLGTAPGYGSMSLAQLSKGSETGYYDRLISQVKKANEIATNSGKKLIVRAFSWAQGFNLGTGLSGSYAENLEKLRTDIDSDVKAITGQSQDVKCITWQSFLYASNAKSAYNNYVGASETYPNIICAGPVYHLDNVTYASGTKSLHFVGTSQNWLGAYFGIAYKRTVIDGEKFVPLKPISALVEDNTMYVKFNVPEGQLTFDTTRVAAVENYGFRLFDDANAQKSITEVSISSADTIKVVCSDNIQSTDRLVYGSGAGTTFGRIDGNRGNLRDTQGDSIKYTCQNSSKTVLPMHNWCVEFDKTILELVG